MCEVKERVLLFDDDSQMRALRDAIQEDARVCDFVTTESEFVKAVQGTRYDGMIIDLMMNSVGRQDDETLLGYITGAVVFLQKRGGTENSEVPFVILTGVARGTPAYKEALKRLRNEPGFRSCILKPSDPEVIMAALFGESNG